MTTMRVGLLVTPLKRSPTGALASPSGDWQWDVTAEENVSGKRHAVGRITCTRYVASHRAKDLAKRERPAFVIVSVIVEPTADELPS